MYLGCVFRGCIVRVHHAGVFRGCIARMRVCALCAHVRVHRKKFFVRGKLKLTETDYKKMTRKELRSGASGSAYPKKPPVPVGANCVRPPFSPSPRRFSSRPGRGELLARTFVPIAPGAATFIPPSPFPVAPALSHAYVSRVCVSRVYRAGTSRGCVSRVYRPDACVCIMRSRPRAQEKIFRERKIKVD